eukprot:GHVU01044987.1.p2 GENE.GHVU01044987.1~~GHVU01044987.1.p2  ORF type:complete len:156 (+),score=15.25 GHVU01044987.1:1393-1860(+)
MNSRTIAQNIINDDGSDFVEFQQLMSEASQLLFTDPPPPHRGSVPGRAPNLKRRVEVAEADLLEKFFDAAATYDDHAFRKAVRLPRHMFNAIEEDLHDDVVLKQGCDAAGKVGASVRLKMWVALRYLIPHGHRGQTWCLTAGPVPTRHGLMARQP